jgi:hypothetical protein
MKAYPGSPKGPNPEDDPEFYKNWFASNIPSQFVQYFKAFTETDKENEKEEYEVESDDDDKTAVVDPDALERQKVDFTHVDIITSQ